MSHPDPPHPSPLLLERSRPRVSVLDFTRDEIVAFLRLSLQEVPNVEQACIIGSFATDQLHLWSDIDLVIVQRTELPFPERGRAFTALYDQGIPLDLLIYTPQEFDLLLAENNPFWTTALAESIRLF